MNLQGLRPTQIRASFGRLVHLDKASTADKQRFVVTDKIKQIEDNPQNIMDKSKNIAKFGRLVWQKKQNI